MKRPSMMASHWPPEKLPVREADLKADGYTFFGRNFISSRGIYNCTLQMRSRGQNTSVVSNSPAKEGVYLHVQLRGGGWVEASKNRRMLQGSLHILGDCRLTALRRGPII
jgi:hypothetical protein